MALRRNDLAAFTSRFRLRKKSTVWPALSTARYRYTGEHEVVRCCDARRLFRTKPEPFSDAALKALFRPSISRKLGQLLQGTRHILEVSLARIMKKAPQRVLG